MKTYLPAKCGLFPFNIKDGALPEKMLRQEILSEVSKILVENNWDLPTPGRATDQLHRYHGPDDIVREKTKETARVLQKSEDVREQLIGYLLEAHAHFFRSEESAISQSRKHPDFEEYFRHWFHADPDYVAEPSRTHFKLWFAKPKAMKIQPGNTYWHNQQRNKRT